MEPILDDMTLPELFALHAKLDDDIAEIRKTQGAIDAAIHRKEKSLERPGDPRLLQGITQ